MDYTIYPSTIPENQLLRIEEAEKLYRGAFNDQVFYAVVDPDDLVKFIKHAWQWDKNAMPYYYNLLNRHNFYNEYAKEEGMMSFTEFMKKYRDQLVDNTGKPLVEPVVFKNPDMDIYLWDKFADLKYPKFAFQKGWKFSPCESDNNEKYLPCSDEQLEESIKYFNYAMEGGYHCYEDLTARMLFQQGAHYKDKEFKKINKLTEYRKSSKPERLKLAIDYAEIMAEHSSIIGILRVTEAYLYSLGREQDPVKAYAWSLLSDYAKQKIIEIDNNLAWDYYQLSPVWEYNKQIQTRLEQILTPVQKQAAQNELAELKTKIIDWNYNRWQEQIDDFHPKP
ncbi:hypothetical protein H3S75_12745 [Gilliamella sp. B14384G15]|uniref:hypothetical protein n=1 Tax=unclassified Gilliamella TaxID=2685620 RepID=UPI0018DDD637|nr:MULTISPECIES: hypothetical protein [unclassified Gilliamella]MBI0032105.1 hypothetical protein [Gilliamella sp. B14384G15]MBI0059399.1 hypothetical protein [Gilliamella sp. B14384G12]